MAGQHSSRLVRAQLIFVFDVLLYKLSKFCRFHGKKLVSLVMSKKPVVVKIVLQNL